MKESHPSRKHTLNKTGGSAAKTITSEKKQNAVYSLCNKSNFVTKLSSRLAPHHLTVSRRDEGEIRSPEDMKITIS
jgi:hypothetical protein